MVATKVLRILGRLLQKGSDDSRFEGLREGARHQGVINNGCNVGEKTVNIDRRRKLEEGQAHKF